MTERSDLQKETVAKLREHAQMLKRSVATWQILARAANEIERLQAIIDATHGEKVDNADSDQ